MRQIRTEAFIDSPPERVWDVLAAFDSYADWNPLNIKASGEARLGAKIPMTFVNPARAGATIDQIVTITAFDPGHRLAWRGHVPLLFTGDHYFELSTYEGGTRLIHGETMSGLIAMRFSPTRIACDFVPMYEAANRALADRVRALKT